MKIRTIVIPLCLCALGARSFGQGVDGVWLGTLHTGPTAQLRLQFHLQTKPVDCSLDSLDQNAFGIPCSNLVTKDGHVSLDVPAVGAKFAGTLSANGKTLSGTFTQGADLPLVLEKQATAIGGVADDTAMPAVALADLKSVLDHDLAEAMKSGALTPDKHEGITIGVVQHGERKIFTYGEAKPDSVYEIGSITKTFTSLILAQMVEQKQVRLDEPVRELLPAGTVSKPEGAEITLLDLSDQHSGLPRMPTNFKPKNRANPYADYDAKQLYAFMNKQGVALPANAPFLYSNLGVGLLGQALSERAGMPYPKLLQEEVLTPLGLKETAVTLTPEMQARFAAPHNGNHEPSHAWDLVALAGAGAIRSTANDMLTYLEAQLHPEALPASVATTKDGATLSAAIADTHVIHAEVAPGRHIALNWFKFDAGGYFHNGATGGYSAYALFNPKADFAVIVLCNTSPGDDTITDQLGMHIAARLLGKPTPPLGKR